MNVSDSHMGTCEIQQNFVGLLLEKLVISIDWMAKEEVKLYSGSMVLLF